MKRAMTLIEVLTVMTLLTLIAGMGVSRLARASERARLASLCAELRDLDARARVLALSAGGKRTVIDVATDGAAVRLRLARDLVAHVALPEGFSVRAFANEGPGVRDGVVSIDGRGRSDDYRIELSCGSATECWMVHGTSGMWMGYAEGAP